MFRPGVPRDAGSSSGAAVAKTGGSGGRAWSEELFDSFQRLVTFGEFDKSDFARHLCELKDLFYEDAQPPVALKTVVVSQLI
jgi:hypothetical protein